MKSRIPLVFIAIVTCAQVPGIADSQSHLGDNQSAQKMINSTRSEEKPLSKQASIRRGKHLYDKGNCKTCHSIAERGGTFGPALDKLDKHATDLIMSEAIHGGADEPEMDFKTRHLTKEEQKSIIDYLLSIQKKRTR